VERKGFTWHASRVVEYRSAVWLVLRCPSHGQYWTKLSSDTAQFRKAFQMASFSPWSEVWQNPTVENAMRHVEAAKTVKVPGAESGCESRALMIDLPIFKKGEFVADEDLLASIRHFGSLFTAQQQFVLKLIGGLALSMEELNRKVLFVDASMPPLCSVLLELTFERMIDLSRIRDSALLRARVFPVITMFVEQGKEEEARTQLAECLDCLRELSDMVVLVTLVVDRPFPDLAALLEYLRSQSGVVRFIHVTVQRSMTHLLALHKQGTPLHEAARATPQEIETEIGEAEARYSGNADIWELIQGWEAGTGLVGSDFEPLATGMLSEPFLETLGQGSYSFRPSPLAGVATCLINSKERFRSVPAPRILDMEKLFRELAPTVVHGTDGLGLRQYAKIGYTVQDCIRPGHRLPDLVAKVDEGGQAGSGKVFEIMRDMQVLLVQSPQDIFCCDLVSQCWPFQLAQPGTDPAGLVRPNVGIF